MKLKVLFVRSGNKGQHPITQNQGESLSEVGCDVVYFDVLGKGVLGYLNNLSNLRERVKTFNPDVIHAHYSLCGFLVALGFFGKPVVVSLMGSDVLSTRFIHRLLIKLCRRFFWNLILVKSDEMYNQLGDNKALVIPNGVNKKDFHPGSKTEARRLLGWNEESRIVLFGSDPKRAEKNYPLFKETFELLRKMGIDAEERCLLNLNKYTMNLYYNACDVLLLTSIHEGSPNVVKEAMFCNCPFVSVDVGDVSHWATCTEGNKVVDSNAVALSKAVYDTLQAKCAPVNDKAKEVLDAVLISERLKLAYLEIISAK